MLKPYKSNNPHTYNQRSNSMTVSEKLLNIKKLFFNQEPAPEPAPEPAKLSKVVGYNVDGGVPVYVSKEEGSEGIAVGDMVFSDEAMTIPYPDGSHKIGDFGFTVSAGAVASVEDPEGKGAGTPIQKEPAPEPVVEPAPVAATSVFAKLDTPEEMLAAMEKFDEGTPEDKMSNMALMVKALMGNVFGWQIAEAANKATQSAAIAAYQTGFEAQEKTIKKQDEIIKEMFSLVEQLVKAPVADPVDAPRDAFRKQKFQAKEDRLSSLTSTIQELKNKH